jgi:hypothetical protein
MSRVALPISTARRVACLLAAAAAAVPILAPAPARADERLLSFMMDDDLLVYHSHSTREFTLDIMQRLGVDGVRVTVSWKFVSGEEGGRPKRRPARFRRRGGEDPRNYRSDIWDRFDDIVRMARERNMQVLLNVTGPGPVWAHPRAPRSRRFDQPAWKPNAEEFRKFVRAVGLRYSGFYPDDNQGGGPLPRVTLWSVWNEPNQPASLSPQLEYNRTLRRQVPVAPMLYRRLYYAATSALRATGHADDIVLMGETAPLGAVRNTPRVHLWPKQFIREMLCVTPRGGRYGGREAQVRGCDDLGRNGPFLVSGWAHHPYTQRNPPTRRDVHRDSINMANIGDLPVLLDRMATQTGLLPHGLPVALTESGWETNPPDPTRGVHPVRQAEYLNVAQRMAYEHPRITAETQFILRDVEPRAQYRGQRRRLAQYWGTWQSGLLFADGRAKPALFAYAMPIDVRAAAPTASGGRTLDVWGQLRFLDNDRTHEVYLEFRPAGSRRWAYAAGPVKVDNPMGFYRTSIEVPGPGVVRATAFVNGQPLSSREASAAF